MKRYTVWFVCKHTRVQLDGDTIMQKGGAGQEAVTAKAYNGAHINFNGLEGAIVDKAVKKLFGKNCFWYGDPDNIRYGEVFDWVRKDWSITYTVVLKCTYQDKGETVTLF